MDIQWDPDEKWDFEYQAVLPFVDVFLPNESEIMALTGEPDRSDAIRKLRDHANMVVVKCGEKGAYLWKEGDLIHREAYVNRQVVDAIGAGDSFNAGFIHRFLAGAPAVKCLDFANLIGAISTTAPGGTEAFSDPEQIMRTARTRFNYEE